MPNGDLTLDFSRSEFACKCGCGFDAVSMLLVNRLQAARNRCGFPLIINSGCRCAKHNSEEQGVRASAHLTGQAADVHCVDPFLRYRLVEALYFAGFTRIKVYKTWIHVDVDETKVQEWMDVD